MRQKFSFRLQPAEAADAATLRSLVAAAAAVAPEAVTGYHLLKQSIDARSRTPWVQVSVEAFINEPFSAREKMHFNFQDVHHAPHRVIVVGAGPAGLFAALRLCELGIKPIVFERGKAVRERRRDLATLNKEGIVNPESNYCFGEGGAGTYSDGKLYTRSNKRGNIARILELFVQFGAEERILYEAHPHIGTNKLPQIISAMRAQIIACGGEVHFEAKVTDLLLEKDNIKGVVLADESVHKGDAVVLATGHSARDIFSLLHEKKIAIEAKPFALGVRVEHPQELIDRIQYHCTLRDPYLPPAAYSLVEQVAGKGVFSFCMCPGGIIAPAATAPEELVVNGWSPSKRNNPFANSGIVVSIETKDAYQYFKKQGVAANADDPLLMMQFQQAVERNAFRAGGGRFVAPAQRMTDMTERKTSASLPACSYLPGIASADLQTVLPDFVFEDLRGAFRAFGKKMKGYLTQEAVVVATESRTSSPVRIPRNEKTLQHIHVTGLYPCAEGAGYAGGIVSAAMDGEKVAEAIHAQIFKPLSSD